MIIYDINAIFNLKKKKILLPVEIKRNIDDIIDSLEKKINKKNKLEFQLNNNNSYVSIFKTEENNKYNLIEKKINITLNSLSKINYNQVNISLKDILDSCQNNREQYEKYAFNIIKDNSIKINMLSEFYIKLLSNIKFKDIIEIEVDKNINCILNKEIFNYNSNGFIIYIGQLYNYKFLSFKQLQIIIEFFISNIENEYYTEKIIVYLYELLKTIKDIELMNFFKNEYKTKIEYIYEHNTKISTKLKFKLLDINELTNK